MAGPLPETERRNRAFWDADAYQAAHRALLDTAPAAWGVWRIPEAELGVLGHVAGLDISTAQLAHARRRVRDHDVSVPLVCASATSAPFADASFDLVFCDHGAMSFCDPARTIPECARLLRDGGRLVFCIATQLLYLTWDPRRRRQSRRLHAHWRERWTVDSTEGTVDVIWSHGEWIRELRRHGLDVHDLVELRAPEDATTTYEDFVPLDWARRWPAEEIWCVTRRSRATR